MSEERAISPTDYYLGSLNVDGVLQLPDITDICQEFVTKGNRFLQGSVLCVPTNTLGPNMQIMPMSRRILAREEMEGLALDTWVKYGTDGASDRGMAVLGGLRLALVSAVQFLGVEETKKSMNSRTQDRRAKLVKYFYGLYQVEHSRLYDKGRGRPLLELKSFEVSIEESLKQRVSTEIR